MRISDSHKDLIHRYLLWAYKTTRESYERIERKTTQLMVDGHILKILHRKPKTEVAVQKDYRKFVEEFEQYIAGKKEDEIKQKFTDGRKKAFHPQYIYLKRRLLAIEDAIKYFLGPKALKTIKELYEKEFINRILQAREHI